MSAGATRSAQISTDLSWKGNLEILFIFLAMKFNLKSIKIKKVYTGGGVGMCPGDNAPKEEARASKACVNKFIS